MDFGLQAMFGTIGTIFVAIELSILIYLLGGRGTFLMTKYMKKIVNRARLIGKPIFILIMIVSFLLELIPNLISFLIMLVLSVLLFLSDKNRSFKECFKSFF